MLRNLAEVEFKSGRHDAARAGYAEAQDLCQEAHDTFGEGMALRDLGAMERKLGRHHAARTAYDEALRIFQRSKDLEGQVQIYRHLGHLEKKRDPRLAKQHYTTAADICASMGNTRREKWYRQRADKL